MPAAGWFAYPPLSGPQYSPGKGVDVWAQMITFTEISALCNPNTVMPNLGVTQADALDIAAYLYSLR